MKTLFLAAAALSAIAAPAAAQTVAITNARLVVGDGSAPIDGATVVVRDGRIVSAGRGGAPAGMRVVDAGGHYVTPGIFAGFTRMGIVEVDGVDETNDAGASQSPFHAALDVAPAVNPKSSPLAINRLEGVTRAVVAPNNHNGSVFAGQGAIIDLGVDMDAVSRPRAFQFMEYGEGGGRATGGSRAAAYAMLKNTLFEVRDYARNPARYIDRGRDSFLTRADAEALVPVVQGREPLLVHVERASDILVLLDLKREVPGLKLVLVGASEGWTVARQIAAAGVPVIANALNDLPESFEQLAATQSNVGRLKAAGVVVGIGTINQDEARQARWEKQFAGNLVALTKVPGATGLDWNSAFAAITSRPAEALGMGGEFGSLRPGRRGDVVIWDGDPLEIGTSATSVFIDGVEQPMASRQTRLRERYWNPAEGALPKAYQH
jgi:imidazolonepropionase-like amidohydrolase